MAVTDNPDLRAKAFEPRPFPFAPLHRLIGRTDETHLLTRDASYQQRFASDEDRAHVLGVGRRQIARFHHNGLTVKQADHFATRVGLHPSAIWGQLWFDVIDALEDDDG